jgi:hypothetical protein
VTHTIYLSRVLLTGTAALAVAAGLALPQQVHADTVVPPTVPPDLQVPQGNKAFLVGHAVGTQNYACTAPGAWSFVGPQATLNGDNGQPVATHFAVPGSHPPAPEWQATDGSTAVGRQLAAVTISTTAIPWLLLRAASTNMGAAGGNRLSGATYIQRVSTAGGLAPSTPCITGNTAHVPYTADYYFYLAATAK